MYHLPDVLIDYIFSFDSNDYHKKKYSAVMKELNFWYDKRRTQLFISCKYNVYDIYRNYHIGRKYSMLTLSQYMLWISKQYSHDVHVSGIKYKLQYPYNPIKLPSCIS